MMSELMTNDVKLTSLDIAEITGKRHADVMRDVRKESEELGDEIAQRIFALGSYHDKNNQERPCYTFGKAGAQQLALKYDAKTRYEVLQHVIKLERGLSLVNEIMNNPEVVNKLAEQVAQIKIENNQHYEKTSQKLETIDKKIEGEYVTPQDLYAINYAIKVKSEKFVEETGVQITIDSVLLGDIYEQAKASKKAKEQYKYDIGKMKRKLLVATKKHLEMKGNAPNNHIKRKDVDRAIQFIKQVKLKELA